MQAMGLFLREITLRTRNDISVYFWLHIFSLNVILASFLYRSPRLFFLSFSLTFSSKLRSFSTWGSSTVAEFNKFLNIFLNMSYSIYSFYYFLIGLLYFLSNEVLCCFLLYWDNSILSTLVFSVYLAV